MTKCCWVMGITGGVCVDFGGLVVHVCRLNFCFSTVILMCSCGPYLHIFKT